MGTQRPSPLISRDPLAKKPWSRSVGFLARQDSLDSAAQRPGFAVLKFGNGVGQIRFLAVDLLQPGLELIESIPGLDNGIAQIQSLAVDLHQAGLQLIAS